MSKKDDDRKRWIEDTQMYQRIAGTPETSAEELSAEWASMNKQCRKDAAKTKEE